LERKIIFPLYSSDIIYILCPAGQVYRYDII